MAEGEESSAEDLGDNSMFACPSCGQEFAITPAEAPQVVRCPACEAEVVVPASDGSTEVPLEYADPRLREAEEQRESESELDGLRMRQIVTAKRAAIRSRTYMLLGAMLCAVGCAKLITLIVPHVRGQGWTRLALGYAIFAGLAVVGTLYCLKRAGELNRESRARAMPEPATPPDFSTLSDGSQQARNLEEIR
jgi:hypothetical protein